jgi:tetratricopeptide (TPR) repeat protein
VELRLSAETEPLVNAAVEAFQQRDRDRAAGIAAYLLRERAPLGSAWETVVKVARGVEETSLALAAQHYFIADAPQDLRRQWELGVMLLSYGRTDDAIRLSQRLIARAPQAPAFHQLLGNAYAQTGQIKEARESFARALAIKPDVAESWLAYAQLKTFAAGDPDIARMREIVGATPNTSSSTHGVMHYALGKALDDSGDVDAAFATFETGARLIRQETPYDRAADEAFVDDVTANWNAEFVRSLTPSGESGEDITFVLGLPRSGTTLAEQILVSHSAFAEGAETSLFPRAALAFPDFTPGMVRTVAQEPRWNDDVWPKVARSYLHMMRDRFATRSGRLVDKTLSYVRLIGAIAHALPSAKFIWMQRDPAATAWSCYRTCFAGPQNWSWSLADIGHHFRLQDRLFAHWAQLYSNRIRTIQYEELVRAPDTEIPRMLAFLGLEDERQTRNFHQAPRSVRTASIAQVRQPLYASALSSWERYKDRMQDFFDAYEKA